MKKQFSGFLDFVREQGVIALAVGLILGVAAKDVVTAFVSAFIDPLIGLILPGADSLSEASFSISDQVFKWGQFVSTLIEFLIIAAVVYFVVSKLAKVLDKKKD